MPEFHNNQRVEQNHWEFCDKPVELYTVGLGPCIGVCIPWRKCAAMVHSADISSDEHDVIAAMISKIKTVIPKEALNSVHPVVCGGDTADPSSIEEDPEELEKTVLNNRQKILQILTQAGFGKTCVRWSDKEQTVDLIADLEKGTVSVYESGNPNPLQRWKISDELNGWSKRRTASCVKRSSVSAHGEIKPGREKTAQKTK